VITDYWIFLIKKLSKNKCQVHIHGYDVCRIFSPCFIKVSKNICIFTNAYIITNAYFKKYDVSKNLPLRYFKIKKWKSANNICVGFIMHMDKICIYIYIYIYTYIRIYILLYIFIFHSLKFQLNHILRNYNLTFEVELLL